MDEIKVMRSLMETDRRNMEGMIREIDSGKLELKQKNDAIDQLRNDLYSKEEELKVLRRSHELSVELKESLKKEEIEKTQLSARLDQVTEALETAREAISKQQVGLTTVGLEHQLASREVQDLRATAATVADVCRENERLKSRVETHRTEIMELTHKLSNLNRDYNDCQTGIRNQEQQLDAAKEEIALLRSQKVALEKSKEELQLVC